MCSDFKFQLSDLSSDQIIEDDLILINVRITVVPWF